MKLCQIAQSSARVCAASGMRSPLACNMRWLPVAGSAGISTLSGCGISGDAGSRQKILSGPPKSHMLPRQQGRSASSFQENVTPNPIKGVLVYRGERLLYTKKIKFLSLGISGIGVLAQPWVQFMAENPAQKFTGLLFGGLTLLAPYLVYRYIRQYVKELYYDYDTDEFTAVTLDFLNRDHCLRFTPSEATIEKAFFSTVRVDKADRSLFIEFEKMVDKQARVSLLKLEAWREISEEKEKWEEWKKKKLH